MNLFMCARVSGIISIIAEETENGTLLKRYEKNRFRTVQDCNREVNHSLEDVKKGLQKWVDGESIQKALSFLNTDEREFILMGMEI